MKYAYVYTVQLVRERQRIPADILNTPADAWRTLRGLYKGYPMEVFSMLSLNARNQVCGYSVVTSGILNSSLVHPREIFQRAIRFNAAGIILAHNHPSGNLEPSSEDLRMTKQMVEAGKIMGIPIHDHIIFTDDGCTSLAERGMM